MIMYTCACTVSLHNHEISLWSVRWCCWWGGGSLFSHCLGGDLWPSHCVCSTFFALTSRPPYPPPPPPPPPPPVVSTSIGTLSQTGNIANAKNEYCTKYVSSVHSRVTIVILSCHLCITSIYTILYYVFHMCLLAREN